MTTRHLSPSLVAGFLTAVVLGSAFLNLPRAVDIGPVSGLGAITLAVLALSLLYWIPDARLGARSEFRVTMSWVLAILWPVASTIMMRPSVRGLQDLAVYLGFLMLFLLARAASRASPRVRLVIEPGIHVAAIISVGMYAAAVMMMGGDTKVISPASAAMLWLLAGCFLLARWEQGSRIAMVYFLIVVALMTWASSRGPLLSALTLLGYVGVIRGRGMRRIGTGILLALVGVSIALTVWLTPELYNSFLVGDRGIQIGDVSINTSGRVFIYGSVFLSYLHSPWFGQGAGSVSDVLAALGLKVTEPHDDYLRLLHDYGAVGLLLWVNAIWQTWCALGRCIGPGRQQYTLGLGARLMVMALLLMMVTDNPIVYSHIMFPLAIVIGIALGGRSTIGPVVASR